jgi:hypothetical protein
LRETPSQPFYIPTPHEAVRPRRKAKAADGDMTEVRHSHRRVGIAGFVVRQSEPQSEQAGSLAPIPVTWLFQVFCEPEVRSDMNPMPAAANIFYPAEALPFKAAEGEHKGKARPTQESTICRREQSIANYLSTGQTR